MGIIRTFDYFRWVLTAIFLALMWLGFEWFLYILITSLVIESELDTIRLRLEKKLKELKNEM